jgi:enamine deaminase RidA (YjgF/YER057c/UK114 family)
MCNLYLVVLAIFITGSGLHATAGPPTADSLAWMTGEWRSEGDGARSEEHWMSPAGGMLMGMHRDVTPGGVTFEHIRIEVVEGALTYLASPQGAPHDFPQRIVYWRDGDKLCAGIAAIGEEPSPDHTWCFEEDIGYSRAVVDKEWVFVSGTTGFDYGTMSISEDLAAQADQRMKNIQAPLRSAGADLRDVVRVLYVVPNPDDFPECWPVLGRYFGAIRPAAMMVSAKLMDPRMRLEIEVTAKRRSGP